MNFKTAGKIIEKTREKIFDDRLWERWLVELTAMDEKTFISFEDYRKKVLEYCRLKSRTVEEKKVEFDECRKRAKEARKRLNPLKDLGRR
jgi:hypothetical protein